MAAALSALETRLGERAPSLEDLVVRGAAATLRELDAGHRDRDDTLETLVDRLRGVEPDPGHDGSRPTGYADPRP